ncbi:unnamed protein product [Staurois parvus]|uniref:Uncharacterized protein n=1 Tax=Staurois parvus TaxID=386267 RepID=A0ABN9ASG4_9NEOB|nr:unnamed protein product [Staurois parvus]
MEDTEWREGWRTLSGGIGREGWRTLSGGIGREGWRTLNGDQWRDWQRGWRTPSGGQWRDWQRGVEDTEWRPVEGLAERDGGH